MGYCYLLHLVPNYKQARHYLGYAEQSVEHRVKQHQSGNGAKLTRVAVDNGCELVLVRVWANVDKKFERALKKKRNAPRLCPICKNGSSI